MPPGGCSLFGKVGLTVRHMVNLPGYHTHRALHIDRDTQHIRKSDEAVPFAYLPFGRAISFRLILLVIPTLPILILLLNIPLYSVGHAPGTNDLFVATTGSDSNPCSHIAPCATIAHGATMMIEGTTVHVAPGTHYEGDIAISACGAASPLLHKSQVNQR